MFQHFTMYDKKLHDVVFGEPEQCLACGRDAISVYFVAGVKRAVCTKHIGIDESLMVADSEVDLV